MTIAPEITTTDVATCTDSDDALSRPRQSPMTSRRPGRPWAKSIALVVAVAVMWLIVIAVITVV